MKSIAVCKEEHKHQQLLYRVNSPLVTVVCHTAELGLLYTKTSSDSHYGFHIRKLAIGSFAR